MYWYLVFLCCDYECLTYVLSHTFQSFSVSWFLSDCLILWNCSITDLFLCLGGATLTFALKILHKYPKRECTSSKSHNRGMQIKEVFSVECMATYFSFLCWPDSVRSSGVLPTRCSSKQVGWALEWMCLLLPVGQATTALELVLGRTKLSFHHWFYTLLPISSSTSFF